jgi:hypothetical protein
VLRSQFDERISEFLTESGLEWTRLDRATTQELETHWRTIYGHAFRGRPRLRRGVKADSAYQQGACEQFYVVPFTTGVDGLSVHVVSLDPCSAYLCRGFLVPLGRFRDVEFFISPTDFAWTMVHDHEDYAFGGPYFLRAEWIP